MLLPEELSYAEEDNSTEEVVEESEKSQGTHSAIRPRSFGAVLPKRMETMMLFMWMTCMRLVFGLRILCYPGRAVPTLMMG